MSALSERKDLLGEVKRLVVKVGTSSITRNSPEESIEFLESIAYQVKTLRDFGIEVMIVSSGAIGIGLSIMNIDAHPKDIPTRQAAASIGQSMLMHRWNTAFEKYGLIGAQILLTMDAYSIRETANNLNNTTETLLANGAIPIFNENDAICTKEIDAVFGDNDSLSAVIASNTESDLLIILSDVNGLYNLNPKIHKDAKIIHTVKNVDDVEHMAGDPTTRVGVGGMKTKLEAARICADAGCKMIIASGFEANTIIDATSGMDVGTIFVSDNEIPKKKRWLKVANPNGAIIVDKGAARALRRHRSLLPVGITEVSGTFDAGDLIAIVIDGEEIAHGMSNYSSEDIHAMIGLRTPEADKIMGKDRHTDVINRENMVLL